MTHLLSDLANTVLATAPHGAEGTVVESVVKFFKDGGAFMYVNIFWLAVAVGVIVERIVTLMFRYNLNAPPFMEQISKLVKGGNVDRAVKLCNAAPNSPLARVIRAGLTRANRGEMEIAKSVEEAVLEFTPPVHARIPWLWSLANIATLIGLIGTIIGLIRTFQSLGNVPADQKQAILSAGISEAMNNTAFGLTIAVTCIIFHLFLTAYAKRMVETVELNALKLENLLGQRSPAGAPEEELPARGNVAFYYSKRKLRPAEHEDVGELNIVPYLDILMNLIIFMLLSMTGLATFGILNVSAPSYGGPTQAKVEQGDQPKLLLTVLISKKGFFVAGAGAVLGEQSGSEAAAAGTTGNPTVPKLADGGFDFSKLTQTMVSVKQAFPAETKVIVGAESDIPYESLVQTMDAVRETVDRKLLFPDVTLAAM